MDNNYDEIVKRYKRKKYDTVVDSICAGLTFADNVAVEAGVLAETGLLSELTESACGALPFVIIAATEGSKVILGRKNGVSGVKDCAYRMAKTGVAMGVGSIVCAAAGLWAAIPVTLGARALMDNIRTKAMTNARVRRRVTRLHELNELLRSRDEETVRETEEQAIPVKAGKVE